MDGPKVSGPPTLPARFTRFFGRGAEINEVEGLVARARVLTLTGAPGCGKTRLSIELADRLKAEFSDGVRFVALAMIPGPTSADGRGQACQVWSAIAWALGIADEPERSDEDTVTDALADADLLLSLDNSDHVVDGAAAPRHRAAPSPNPSGTSGAVETLGPAAARRRLAEVSLMTSHLLATEALPQPGDSDHPLSPREQEVAALVADGLSNVQIAERLIISKRTVETHVDHIKRKLRFSTRYQIIAWAVLDSLTSPQPSA